VTSSSLKQMTGLGIIWQRALACCSTTSRKIAPAREQAVGWFAGQHMALLATPFTEREGFMPKEAPSFQSYDSTTSIATRAAAACAELRRSGSGYGNPLPSVEVCEELYVAVEQAATASSRSMRELRSAVERFTKLLKDDGASPEEVLIALKTVINCRTFVVADPRGDVNDLRQQISTWSIEEFFKDKKG
jgi:hypothetical protein